METDLNLGKMEDELNFIVNVYLNGRQPASWQAYLALAFPELGKAQPQLVISIFLLYIKFNIEYCRQSKDSQPYKQKLKKTFTC